MNFKKLFSVALLFILVVSSVHATTKGKSHFKLITAYTRKIPENKQTNPPMAGYFFVIRWESDTYPESFFWRGENGWLTCKIEKAVKGKNGYTGKMADIAKIRKDDLLLLIPLTGGRFPIPEEIPENAKNTIFYKTGGSSWLPYPVPKISKKS